jgi:hypothetical protein
VVRIGRVTGEVVANCDRQWGINCVAARSITMEECSLKAERWRKSNKVDSRRAGEKDMKRSLVYRQVVSNAESMATTFKIVDCVSGILHWHFVFTFTFTFTL